MSSMTLDDRCYYGERDMHAVSTSPNSNDGPCDINGPLLLSFTVATGYMTSDDHCYCWARGTHSVATSPHSSDRHSDNGDPSLLAPTVAMGKRSIATGLPVTTDYLISAVHRY
jgi:hypothetical protein